MACHVMDMSPENRQAKAADRLVIWLAGAGGIFLITAAVLLWAQGGATVFFEMLVAGIMSCF
jgi:uncharacterized membrane protein YdcZ (DUF606 family)